MAFELSFQDLTGLLSKVHGIPHESMSPFAARIKDFQRRGFPPGTNTGKGRRVAYGAEHVFQIAAVMELSLLGFSPDRAITAVSMWWDELRRAILAARDPEEIRMAFFVSRDFEGLTWRSEEFFALSFRKDRGADSHDDVAFLVSKARAAGINISKILEEVTHGLRAASANQEAFWSEVESWRDIKDRTGRALGDRT